MDLSIYRHISITLSLIVILFTAILTVRMCSSSGNDSKKILKYYIEKSKKESDSIISLKQKRIVFLKLKIEKLVLKINDAKNKIDSLENKKQQVQYIYVNKIKEINSYDSKELENYWQSIFNK